MLENIEWAINNGQSRETGRDTKMLENTEWAINNGQSRETGRDTKMLENTEWAINNGQSKETGRDTINVREYRMGNQQWTIQRNWQRYNKC